MQSHPSSSFPQVSHSEKSQGACTWSCEDAQHPAAIAERPSTHTSPGAELSASHGLGWVMVSRQGQPQGSSKHPCQGFTTSPQATATSDTSQHPLLCPFAAAKSISLHFWLLESQLSQPRAAGFACREAVPALDLSAKLQLGEKNLHLQNEEKIHGI